MAHLNVREHRIEAKIAYVGPAPTGIAATFERLRTAATFRAAPSSTDALVALEWRPELVGALRDHDIVVEVLAPSADRFADVLRDADSVIFVGALDGATNEAYLSALREQLALVERSTVPLLVQQQEQEQELATLESALGEVLAAMQRTQAADGTADDRDAAHPLLTALRQVLRETVREHVDEVAARMSARMDAALAEIGARLSALESKTGDDALVLHVIQTLEETDTRLREIAVTVATTASNEDVNHVRTAVEGRLDRATRSFETSLDAVRKSISSDARTLEALCALEAKSADQSAAIEQRLSELVEELKKPKKSWFT